MSSVTSAVGSAVRGVAQNAADPYAWLNTDRTINEGGTAGINDKNHVTGTGVKYTLSDFDYNTSYDSGVGAIDAQIQAQDKVKGTSAYGGDDAYNKLVQQRTALNAQRWSTANLSGSPARDQIAKLIQSGALSYMDLGKIDITALDGDPGALMQQVDALVKAKTAVPPAATPAPATPAAPDPVAAAQQNASDAVSQGLASIQSYAQTVNQNTLGTFDKETAQSGGDIESLSSGAARQTGIGGAASATAEAGEGLQANANAQRQVLQQQASSDIEKFIQSSLGTAVNQNMDVSTMDAQKKVQLQKQGLTALGTALSNSIDTSTEAGRAQVAKVNAAIEAFNNAIAKGEEGTSEMNKIIGIAGGILMAGAGIGADVLTDGAATPFTAPLVAGGVGQVVSSARS